MGFPGETLQARLAARLELAPDSRAVAFVSGRGEYEWITFEQLWNDASEKAAAFSSKGLGRGQVAVMVLPSDKFCIDSLLGCLMLGGVPILVAPPIQKGLHSTFSDVVEHVVNKTDAPLVITTDDRDSLGDLPQQTERTEFVFGPEDCAGTGAATWEPGERSRADVGVLQTTSGTTGFPRICVWRQEEVLRTLDSTERTIELTPDDVCVNWTPLYHDLGLVNNFLLCLTAGVPLATIGTLDFIKRPSLWLRAMPLVGGTITWGPNFGYAITAARVRDQEMEGVRLDGVRSFWNGAEKAHEETIRAFRERFEPFGLDPSALKTSFGCAENVGGATFGELDGPCVIEYVDRKALYAEGVAEQVDPEAPSAVAVVSTGVNREGVEVCILSEEGERLADGRVGIVALDSETQMQGYLGDQQETAEALRDGLVFTGDLGYLRDGQFFWTGRAKERINLQGKKYDPTDFEAPLLKVPGLRPGSFAAFGIDDASKGTQRLVLLSEIRKDSGHDPDQIFQHVRQQVAVELGVHISELLLLPYGSMTKTSSGKRRHRFYRELYLAEELEPIGQFAV